MTFSLHSVVPWGRSFDEYIAMFNLSNDDLSRLILGCGDGPAGFNARMKTKGNRVISCDPLYTFSCSQIRQRIFEAKNEVMQQVRENMQNFTWKSICSPEELEQVRMDAMQSFLDDFEQGKEEGRYISGSLPFLPFQSQGFDLALCSHFLFLYDTFGKNFHLEAILEMLRVAREVRIYPHVNVNGEKVDFLDDLIDLIHYSGFHVTIEKVRYDFLKNGNSMIKISR